MTDSSHVAENEVLRLLARVGFNASETGRLHALLAGPLDWTYLYQLAKRHALVPLVYQRLERIEADSVPSEVLEPFKKTYQENAARNVLLTHELVRLIQALDRSGIEAVPFKGPALSVAAYEDPALRCYVDLDLMVRRNDVQRAREVLLSEDYETSQLLDPRQEQVLLKTQHNVLFSKDNGQLIVELHWRVATQLFAASVSAEELWPNLENGELAGVPVKLFSHNDLLFSLCVHGSRHLWERLSWICDVAAFIMRRACATDTERMVLLGLHLAETLGGAKLPPGIHEQIASDKILSQLAAEITDRLFDGVEPVPATTSEIFRYNFRVRKSWFSRARYGLFTLGPSDRDLKTRSLPRVFNFAYYLVRPIRFLSQSNKSSQQRSP
jgi:hypothetical protein